MQPQALLMLLGVIAIVDAKPSPFGYGDWKPPLCRLAERLATQARQQGAVTSFCSSYLKITTSTVLTTTTSTTVSTITPPPTTTTETVAAVTIEGTPSSTFTIFDTITIPDPTSTITSTSVVEASGVTTSACVSPPAFVPRAPVATAGSPQKRGPPKPAVLQSWKIGNELSSACRCFGIAQPTTTSTLTSLSTQRTTTTGTTVTETFTPQVIVHGVTTTRESTTVTTLQTVLETSTSTSTTYLRPTTPVRLLVKTPIQSSPYFDKTLYSNYSSFSHFGIRPVESYFVDQQDPSKPLWSTLFVVNEQDQSLTSRDANGNVLYARSLHSNGELDDPNRKFDAISFRTPDNYVYRDRDSSPVSCTMSIDSTTGFCPVTCTLKDYVTFREDGNNLAARRFGLSRNPDSLDATYEVYGIPPPS